ncbi:MAG: TolC family protein, partial [Ignavibacteria bacterium]
AKVNKIKFENEIRNTESQIKIFQSELKKLMNVEYTIIPADDLKFDEIILSQDNLLKKAYSNNPELTMSRFQRQKFSNKRSLSKSELFPSFSFRYYNQKIGGENGFWGFEIGLGIPLWFWWEQTGNIKEADYEYRIASSDEIGIRKNIESELDQSYVDYQNSLRQLKFFRDEAIKESDEILRQAKIGYEEGAIDYVEYLQALNVSYDTKTQYLNSIFSYKNSIIRLEKITAGEIK